jgi:endo-1,4-beta-xylanase
MVSFRSLLSLVVAAAVGGVSAFPSNSTGGLDKRQSLTSSSTGTNGGYYYSFWTDGGAQVTYTNKANGEYSVTWSGNGNFVAGKGWMPGAARRVIFPLHPMVAERTIQVYLFQRLLQPERQQLSVRLRLDREPSH